MVEERARPDRRHAKGVSKVRAVTLVSHVFGVRDEAPPSRRFHSV